MSLTVLKEFNKIPSLIMDYLDEEPPRYHQVRKKICFQFQIPKTIQFKHKDIGVLNYHLIYQSPKVGQISQAAIILIAEYHDSETIRASNAYVMDGLVCKDSVFFAEGVISSKDDPQPLLGRAREIVLNTHCLPESHNRLTVYGWDNVDRIQPILDLEERQRSKPASPKLASKPRGPSLDDLEEDEIETQERAVLERPETIYSMFPDRTRAMIKSLEQLESSREKGLLSGKAIYVAGLNHLYCPEALEDSNMSLKSLYHTLRTLPAIVICTKECLERQKREESSHISIIRSFI